MADRAPEDAPNTHLMRDGEIGGKDSAPTYDSYQDRAAREGRGPRFRQEIPTWQ